MSERIKIPMRNFTVPGLDGVSFMASHNIADDGMQLRATFMFYAVANVDGNDLGDNKKLADSVAGLVKILKTGIAGKIGEWP